MKNISRIVIALCLSGLAIAQCSKPRNAANEGTATSDSATGMARGDTTAHPEKGWKLVAYYLHGTVRCPTCLSIEKQSKEIVETEFAVEVQEGKVVFLSLNYDEPENEHFGDDYNLPSPSLVLSLRNNGKEVKWKILPEVWEHVHDPPAFREYVAAGLREMLTEMR